MFFALGLILAACGQTGGESAQPSAPAGGGGVSTGASPSSPAPIKVSPTAKPKQHGGGGGGGTGSTTSSGGAGGSSTGGGSGGSGSHDNSSSSSGGAQSIDPRQPGTYHYDTDGQTTYGQGFSSPMPSDTTLTVSQPSGVTQRSTRDMRDSQGNGSVTDTWLEFRDDGVYLDRVRTTTQFGPAHDVRELRPAKPALVGKPGAGPGSHTEFTMHGSGTTAKVTIDVLRKQTLTIDGKSVDTFLVRTHTTFSGDLQGESTADTWYTPDRLLPVKEHVTTDAQTSAGSFHSEYRAQLQKLSPS